MKKLLGVILGAAITLTPFWLRMFDVWPLRGKEAAPAASARLDFTAMQLRDQATAFVQVDPTRTGFIAHFGQPYVVPFHGQEQRLAYECSDHLLVIVVNAERWEAGYVDILEFVEPPA